MVSHWCFEVAPRILFPLFQRRAQASDLSLDSNSMIIVIVALKMTIMIVVVIISLMMMIKNNANCLIKGSGQQTRVLDILLTNLV